MTFFRTFTFHVCHFVCRVHRAFNFYALICCSSLIQSHLGLFSTSLLRSSLSYQNRAFVRFFIFSTNLNQISAVRCTNNSTFQMRKIFLLCSIHDTLEFVFFSSKLTAVATTTLCFQVITNSWNDGMRKNFQSWKLPKFCDGWSQGLILTFILKVDLNEFQFWMVQSFADPS